LAARFSGPPLNEGPTAALIGRKREFISVAAAMAAPAPPPAAMIVTEANCAEPANTIAENTIAATWENPASSARMPKDAARMKPATANGAPRRRPRRKLWLRTAALRSRRSSCRTRRSRSSAR
jgi:hypothetical protein